MSIHPSCLPEDELLKDCLLRSERRSGPGGQHRNKVETAVVATHCPTGITAEGSERRSQVDNRRMAITRLRLALAVRHRCVPQFDTPSPLWLSRARQARLSVAEEHDDFPSLLAELMDRLHVNEYRLPECSQFFCVSTSQLIKLLRQCPAAFTQVNAARNHLGMHKLS